MPFDRRAALLSIVSLAESSIASHLRRHVALFVFLTFFCCAAGTAQVINKDLPINGKNGQVYLSPPLIDPTGQCSTRVKISSFIPGATIYVYLTATEAGAVSPKKLIGGPTALAVNGMTVHLTQALKALDELEATQTFLGVTSALSVPHDCGSDAGFTAGTNYR